MKVGFSIKLMVSTYNLPAFALVFMLVISNSLRFKRS